MAVRVSNDYCGKFAAKIQGFLNISSCMGNVFSVSFSSFLSDGLQSKPESKPSCVLKPQLFRGKVSLSSVAVSQMKIDHC